MSRVKKEQNAYLLLSSDYQKRLVASYNKTKYTTHDNSCFCFYWIDTDYVKQCQR